MVSAEHILYIFIAIKSECVVHLVYASALLIADSHAPPGRIWLKKNDHLIWWVIYEDRRYYKIKIETIAPRQRRTIGTAHTETIV